MHCNDMPAWQNAPMPRLRADMTRFPAETPPAMAYVPFQLEFDTYAPEEALCAGTLFPVLDKPFTGKRGVLR